MLFEEEWSEINSHLKPLLNEEIERIALMAADDPGQFPLHTGKYTTEREKLLVEKTVEHIKEEPAFYLKTRIFTFCRLWFTGISVREWNDAVGLPAKIKVIYPFLVSFVFLFLGLVSVTIAIFFKKITWEKFYFLFLLTVYYGVIHTPFAYQSRFTAPVNLFILLMLSFVVASLIFDRVYKNQTDVALETS